MRPSTALGSVALLCVASVGQAQNTDVKLLDYHAAAPAGWATRAPSSTARLAEFVIGKGSPDSAEVVAYFFGPQQKANVDANLTRWKGSFSNPDGSPVFQLVSTDSSGKFPLTFAEFHGSYRRGIGAGSADSVRAGQALIASIVQTPKGVMYIQIFGPIARVAAERGTFVAFIKGIK